MTRRNLNRLAGLATAAAAVGVSAPPAAAEPPVRPEVKVVALDPGESQYVMLLAGPPETASIKSGLVTLAPGASIGVHNTKGNEEMLVPLEGEGELRIAGRAPIAIRPGLITYAPAHTEHDVVNTGTARLRYIFIVARAE